MPRFIHSLILILLGLAGLLVACQDQDGTPAPPAVVVTEVVTLESGDQVEVTRIIHPTPPAPVAPTAAATESETSVVLDVSTNGSYSGLDPQLTVEDNAVDIMENIFAGLTRYNLKTNTVDPELAASWSVSDDGRTWTFDLRDDVYWVESVEEGPTLLGAQMVLRPVRQVTAGDVVYAIRRACDPGLPTPDAFTLFIIEGCERVIRLDQASQADLESIGARAISNQTLEIDLTRPADHFLTMTSTWLMRPVPQDLVEQKGEEWHLPGNVWFSGPFVLGAETLMESRTVLERNPLWPIPFSGNVDRVNILHLADDNDAYVLWEDRDLDLGPVPIAEQTNILSRYQAKADLITNQDVFYLAYNFNSPAFSVPEVRQAFGAAIDRERLIREVHGDRAMAMRHLGPPGVVGAPPIDEVGTGYSPDLARQLMDNSVFGDCRLMPPVTYLVSSSDIALQQAELLRQMWMEELGCTEEQIIIEQVQFGQLLANTRPDAPPEVRPDMWDLGWASYYPDESNWLGDVLHCEDSENRQLRPCSNVDDVIRQADSTVDLDRRWELYRRAERSLFGGDGLEPVTPLFVRGNYVLRQGWVSYTPAHFGGEQYDTYLVDPAVKELERNR